MGGWGGRGSVVAMSPLSVGACEIGILGAKRATSVRDGYTAGSLAEDAPPFVTGHGGHPFGQTVMTVAQDSHKERQSKQPVGPIGGREGCCTQWHAWSTKAFPFGKYRNQLFLCSVSLFCAQSPAKVTSGRYRNQSVSPTVIFFVHFP